MKDVCKVMIIDDHELVQCALRYILEKMGDIKVEVTASCATEAMVKLQHADVDVVLVDITLPDGLGINLLGQIKKRRPELRCIVMTMHEESKFGMRAVLAGADGYLMKTNRPDTIVDAVRRVWRGGTYFSDALQQQVLKRASGQQIQRSAFMLPILSNRELEVLCMLGSGMNSLDIARNLNRSIKTIDAHREHIKKKLSLGNATELIRFAICWVEDNQQSQRLNS